MSEYLVQHLWNKGKPFCDDESARPWYPADREESLARPVCALCHQRAMKYGRAGERAKIAQLLADLVDPDECWFDHNGGCQAHGYLSLGPGEVCPHAEAKQWLAAIRAVSAEQEGQ